MPRIAGFDRGCDSKPYYDEHDGDKQPATPKFVFVHPRNPPGNIMRLPASM
jgi:hypothetical protein